MKKKLKIFALGGNEVSPTGRVDHTTGKLLMPDIAEQWRRTAQTCSLLAGIIKENPDDYYILTHGNGPQVGNMLLMVEHAGQGNNILPLDVCDAGTQGSMGYMLSQLTNALRIEGIDRIAAETISRVVVSPNDPAFSNPSKFIGPSYTKEDALRKVYNGYRVKFYKINGNGEELWRWVVPSPVPLEIVEIDLIENNMKSGIIPIAVGGGGIPVIKIEPRIENGFEIYDSNFGIIHKRIYSKENPPAVLYSGVEAVVDKDLASALLGTLLINRAGKNEIELDAELIIFTDVDGAKLNYQKPDQTDLRHLSVDEIKKLYEEGNFPAGSMGPKVKAAINFIEGGGKKVMITKADLYYETLDLLGGTTITA